MTAYFTLKPFKGQITLQMSASNLPFPLRFALFNPARFPLPFHFNTFVKVTNIIHAMKRIRGSFLMSCCALLLSCQSSREVVVNSPANNPHLNHYLTSTHNTSSTSGHPTPTRTILQNQKHLQEEINPTKEALWSDLISNTVQALWPNLK